MTVLLDKQPSSYLSRLNEPDYSRILNTLEDLTDDPPSGDIKKMSDRGDYRLRIGGYRIIFRMEGETIIVSKIAPRGQSYKEN
jgi:mRNA interferase RelE/StbE